ncbi:1437_t:CDS:1 [Funneliformis geosporum]|uniref:16689_t:CDS:1 n=1 Tax=Funneliformis geosporum TaxID=1117311 RepID=A0A9W4WKX5_9GLOM|nr:16689_t:CDS:1 [Funneliformis geosporum]CAI2165237.1 1437_t:CDS:1 [Funneliformis geosporum]
MTSFLPPECLEKIFLILYNPLTASTNTATKDIHACTLVSRYWCNVSTPLLYSYPFQHFANLNSKSQQKDVQDYYKLIRTLLTCIPQSEIEEIINSKILPNEPISFSLKSSPTFDYGTFFHGLQLGSIFSKVHIDHDKIWMPSYIPTDTIPIRLTFELYYSIINHLVKYLSEFCKNLTILEIKLFTFNDENVQIKLMETLLNSFFDDSKENKLTGLKSLYFAISGNAGTQLMTKEVSNLSKFYANLSSFTKNLESLHNGKIISLEQANALSSLISSQKRLKSITLSQEDFFYSFTRTHNIQVFEFYNVVFNTLRTQSAWLEKLEFTLLSFQYLDQESLDSLCSLKNLKELKIMKCKFLDKLKVWTTHSHLSGLQVLEFTPDNYTQLHVDGDWLNKIFQFTSSSLKKLILDFKREIDQGFQLIRLISLHLHSLNYLVLPKLYPTELITILKSCIELVYLSTGLLEGGQWDQNLPSISKFIPNSVEKIQFREIHFLVDNRTFELFLKGCINKGVKLQSLEMTGKKKLDQKYYDIANQFGVKLIS